MINEYRVTIKFSKTEIGEDGRVIGERESTVWGKDTQSVMHGYLERVKKNEPKFGELLFMDCELLRTLE